MATRLLAAIAAAWLLAAPDSAAAQQSGAAHGPADSHAAESAPPGAASILPPAISPAPRVRPALPESALPSAAPAKPQPALPKSASSAAQKNGSTEIMLVMDESGSMKANDPERSRIRAAQLFIGLLPGTARVGLVRFSTDADTVLPLISLDDPQNRDRLRQAIEGLGQGGQWTDMARGVDLALYNMNSGPGPERYVLLFTDGEVDLAEGEAAEQESRRRRRSRTPFRCRSSARRHLLHQGSG